MRASYGLSPGLISTPERSSKLFPASARGSAEDVAMLISIACLPAVSGNEATYLLPTFQAAKRYELHAGSGKEAAEK